MDHISDDLCLLCGGRVHGGQCRCDDEEVPEEVSDG